MNVLTSNYTFTMNSVTKPILLFHLFLSVIVAVDVTCDSVNPMIQSDVACTCKTAPGTDIDWYLDDAFHSSCVLSTICAPQYSGYSFSINMTENVYMMTIKSYDYSNCKKITCKDTYDSSIQQSTIPSSLVFDTTFPSSMTEPGSNNSNGIISVTTGCISGFVDVQYDWYIIVDGLEERYFVYDTNIIDTLDNSLCVNCDTDVNGQRTIGFEHSETSGSGTKTGLFKVSLYHVSTNFQLNLTSRYFYTVKVRSSPTSKSWGCFDEIWCIIIFIVNVSAISYIPAVFIRCNKQRFYKVIKGCNLWILIIPCVGLILITIYCCLFCKDCCRKCKGCYRKNTVYSVKPRTPIEFTYDKSSVTINSFKVRWKYVSNGGSGLKFLLVWSTGNENEKTEDIPYENKNNMEYVITHLNKDTNYDVRICAEINGEKSEFTENLTVKTLVKPRTPINSTHDGSSVTSNSFKVRWTAASNGGSDVKFLLVWSINNEKKKIRKYISYEGNSNMEYVIQNLKESTKYNVKIYAEIGNVQSEFTKPLTVETVEGMLTQCKKKHQRIAGEDEICCENCKETRGAHASHALCLSHRLYLCLTCIGNEHKNEKCVLLWNTRDIERKGHKLCCKQNYNYDDLQLKGVCQAVICSQCIKKDKYVNSTSHQQLHGPLNTRVLMCSAENETTGGEETDNFCVQCKTFMCASCLIHHENHLLISSLKNDMDIKPSLCCELNEKTRGIETDFCIQCNTFIRASCMEAHNNHMVITSLTGCYESGNSPEKRRKKGESEKSFIEDYNKNGKDCQVHAGGEQHFVTNVFCLICKLYMCMGCYIKHRRLYEYWSKHLEGNLFYCNCCPTAGEGNLKPVECYDLQSLEFKCGNCYILNLKTGSNKTSYPKKIKSTMKIYTDTENQCNLHEDLPPDILSSHTSSTANVFCLVCKEYMCKTCFGIHIDRNSTATRNPLCLLG